MTLIFEAEVVGCTFFRFFSLYPPFQMPGSVTKACADESIGLKELRELPRFVGVKHLLILKMLFWKEPQSSFCMPDVTGTFSLCFSFSMVEKRTKKSLQKQCWNRHFFSSHSWCLKHPGFSKYQAWDQIGYGQTVKRKLLTPLPPFCPTKSASVLITSVSAAWWASWPRFHKAVLWAKDWLKDHCMPFFFFFAGQHNCSLWCTHTGHKGILYQKSELYVGHSMKTSFILEVSICCIKVALANPYLTA